MAGQLPRDKRQLGEIFRKARSPEISELNGEYDVHMLTCLPRLKWLRHRKVFYPEGSGVSGHNIMLNDIQWGRFYLEPGTWGELDSMDVVVINYNRPGNLCIIKGVRDHLRFVEDENLYLGRFHSLFFGRLYFLGYFSLTKRAEQNLQ